MNGARTLVLGSSRSDFLDPRAWARKRRRVVGFLAHSNSISLFPFPRCARPSAGARNRDRWGGCLCAIGVAF